MRGSSFFQKVKYLTSKITVESIYFFSKHDEDSITSNITRIKKQEAHGLHRSPDEDF